MRHRSGQRATEGESARRDDRGDPAAGRSQEELWAASIAEEPELIRDIVKFIATARERLIESPPVAPTEETNRERRQSVRRK